MNLNKLEELFDKCYEVESEYLRQWSGLNSVEWNSEKMDSYKHGVIMYLYIEKDPLLLELINQNYDYQQLYRLICREIDKTDREIQNRIPRNSKSTVKKKTAHPTEGENLVKWYRKYNSYKLELLEDEPENRVFSILYIELSYAEYSSKRKYDDEKNQPQIHELYSELDDKDFKKWNLIPVGTFRKLKALDPPRLYDSNKKRTLIVDIPRPLVDILRELQDRNMIGELSVRCKNNGIFTGNITKEIIQAEIEKGRLFSLDESTWHGVTKMYDAKEYNNQLWINKTYSSWTFEELCHDFTIEGESVVTQMIHLEYANNLIEHIDYERIYYTLDEYTERIRTQKMDIEGTAQPRRKFFKVNNAAIPFDYPCSALIQTNSGYDEIKCPFIFFVLNCYFQHKDLLNEYFNVGSQQNGT